MSDLVKRLRIPQNDSDIRNINAKCQEAADEIERLQKLVCTTSEMCAEAKEHFVSFVRPELREGT